jgi:hypothetical protein
MFSSRQMSANRRRHERYSADGAATVFQGSSKLELPILDISLTGIRLQATGSTKLEVGSVCFIALPEHGKHDAQVVAVKPQSFGFQFLTPEPEGVQSFIETRARGSRDAVG